MNKKSVIAITAIILCPYLMKTYGQDGDTFTLLLTILFLRDMKEAI